MPALDTDRLGLAYQAALAALLAERNAAGHWTGELSASALSTATAVSALSLVQQQSTQKGSFNNLVADGVRWLVQHQNPDGGWGDTVKSVSNISTSMLVRAAFALTGTADQYAASLQRLESYLHGNCGKTPAEQAEAIRSRYGKDRTFAVPILTMCALAGLVPWGEVTPLPFELACFPQSWFRFLRLPVVSYALPALIAIGQAVFHNRPPRFPITRLVRRLSRKRALKVLERIQPTSGGFLEATPLTSFVTLSLASSGLAVHPVARKGVEFLVQSVRPDGSWPIDTNLATWVTTLAVNALAAAGDLSELAKQTELRDWLLGQQYKEEHPYTGAAPGGWAWTNLPGGVPDADDTPGALLALNNLAEPDRPPLPPLAPKSLPPEMYELLQTKPVDTAAFHGLPWLLGLQNRDGGWPTFCRGWGNLPFDRSGSDLTAHALRALVAWKRSETQFWQKPLSGGYTCWFMPKNEAGQWFAMGIDRPRVELAIDRGLRYLGRSQRPDGSWLPLWFGNQYAPGDENPTYGTARVLAAYRDLNMMNSEPARRGVAWMLAAQNADGGWGGAADATPSVEETALAVEVLLDAGIGAADAVNRGLRWLVQQVESGGLQAPTPIGFYFAKLWYFEKLYPIVFTVAALGRARQKLTPSHEPTRQTSTP